MPQQQTIDGFLYQDKHANEETPRLTDITTIRYVTLYLDSGTKKRYPLNKVDADFMNEYYDTPETGSASVPKYYAQCGTKGH